MYATPQALIDEFGESEMVQLTDRATPRQYQVDDTYLQRACDRAAAEIDGAVGARYQLPLASVPVLLKHLAADLARYYLYDQIEPPTVVQTRYHAARKTLVAIRDGLQPLGLDEDGAGVTAAAQALPAFEGGAKDFARGRW